MKKKEDVTLKRLEELGHKLRDSWSLSDQIINAVPEAVVVVRSDGSIMEANRRVFLLGYQPQELVGQNIEVLIPDEAKPKHLALMGTYFADASVRYMTEQGRPITILHKDGTRMRASIALAPMRVGNLEAAVATLRIIHSAPH